MRPLLEHADAWHYGYDISRRTDLRSGTLYPILVRLAANGWLETRWTEPQPSGRPPRHIYRLTSEGARAAASLLAGQRLGQPELQPRPRHVQANG